MKYKAHLDQGGEGCDYTIGCGHALIDLKAQDMEAAKIELMEVIKERYTSIESTLDSAVILEVGETFELEVSGFYKELERQREAENQAYREKKEKEEFERLKQKFGG